MLFCFPSSPFPTLFMVEDLPYTGYFRDIPHSLLLQKEILNTKLETRNPEPGTRNPKQPNVKQQFKYNVYVLLYNLWSAHFPCIIKQ